MVCGADESWQCLSEAEEDWAQAVAYSWTQEGRKLGLRLNWKQHAQKMNWSLRSHGSPLSAWSANVIPTFGQGRLSN